MNFNFKRGLSVISVLVVVVFCLSLFFVEVPNPVFAFGNNLLAGESYTFGTNPNGSYVDTNPVSKLTDGVANNNTSQSVQWDFSNLTAGATVTITFDMGSANWITQVESLWSRSDSGASGPGPEEVMIKGSLDNSTYFTIGVQRPKPDNTNNELNTFVWSHDGNVLARYLRVEISRKSFASGVVSLNEVKAYGPNNLASGRTYSFSQDPTGTWKDSGKTTLTDGACDSSAQTDDWDTSQTGLSGNFLTITYDLGALKTVNQIDTTWYRAESSGKFVPDDISIEASTDNSTWFRVGASVNITNQNNAVNNFRWRGKLGKQYRYFRIKANRQLGNNINTVGDWTQRNANTGTIACSEIFIFETESALTSPISDNLLRGKSYSLSTTPNGANGDDGSKLTNGLSPYDYAASVQWDFSSLGNGDVYASFDIGSMVRVSRLESLWVRNDEAVSNNPEAVWFEVSSNNSDWIKLTARDITRSNTSVVTWRWESSNPVNIRYIRMKFNRANIQRGVVSLLEVKAFDSNVNTPNATGDVKTAYVYSLIAGNNIFYTPDNMLFGKHAPPLPGDYSNIVKILKENYGANALVVQYNGEVSKSDAMTYYGYWYDACKQYGIELIPAIGLIQFDYCWDYPSDEYLATGGQKYIFYGGYSPMPDISKTSVQNYFKNFLIELVLTYPEIQIVGTWDNNTYPLAINGGYNVSDTDIDNYLKALNSGCPGKQHLIVFQQPGDLNNKTLHPYLSNIDAVLLDTYGYVRDGDWTSLASYVSDCANKFGTVIADLVPGNDADDTVTPGINQALAASTIKSNGGALSCDSIVNSAKDEDSQFNRRDYWLDILIDGFYDGFLVEPWEEVRRQFYAVYGDTHEFSNKGAPGNFTLASPGTGVTGVSLTPTFQWQSSSNATNYELWVSDRPDMDQPVIHRVGLTSTSYTPSTSLMPGRTYFWRVTAIGDNSTSGVTTSGMSYFSVTGGSISATNLNIATGKSYTKSLSPNGSYPDAGNSESTDNSLASSDYSDGKSYGYNIANVGDTITVSITIDLGSAQNVNHTRFHGMTTSLTNYFPDSIQISTSSDNVNYTTRATSSVNIGNYMDVGFSSISARYVRFTFSKKRYGSTDDWMFIDELMVYNNGNASKNILLNQSYTKSLTPNPSYSDSNNIESVDGILASDNYTDGKSYGYSIGTVGNSVTADIIFDLGEAKNLDFVRFHGIRPSGVNYFPDSMDVYTSTDGNYYYKHGTTSIISPANWMEFKLNSTATSRFIKLSFTKKRNGSTDDFMFIDEMEAYYGGDTNVNLLRGLSYTKSTSPAASYPDTTGLESTDGKYASGLFSDGLSYGYNLSTDGNQQYHDFTFDLGSSKNVGWFRTHLVLPNANIYFPDKMEVYTSSNGSDYTLQGSTTNPGNFMEVNVPGINSQYIKFRIYKTKNNRYSDWVFVDEFEAYAGKPGNFILTSPIRGHIGMDTTAVSLTPTFQWTPSLGASSYTLVIAENKEFTKPLVYIPGITGTSYTLASSLTSNTKYYWKVIAVNYNGSTENYIGIKNIANSFLPNN